MSTDLQPYQASPPATASRFSLDEIWGMAKAVAESRLFAGITNVESAYALMLLCEAEGLHPIMAMRRFHIIEGKPAMRADAMQADFQKGGGSVAWLESSRTKVVAKFTHPKHCPDGFTLTLNVTDFDHLKGKANWKNHPAEMLRARIVTQGVRMIDPSVVVGIYTPDEIEEVQGSSSFRDLPMPIDVTAPPPPSVSLPADVPVIGSRSGGHDSRAYVQVVKDAVEAANQEIRVKAESLQLLPSYFDAKTFHGALLRAAVDAGHIEEPKTRPKAGEAIRLLVDTIYPAHREWVRSTLDAAVRGQLADALEILEADPVDPKTEPEDESQELVGASSGREPGAEG
jgi:hypothetical protein